MAERAVEQYGLPVEIGPQEALIEELHRTAGHVAWLGAKIAELEAHEMHSPVGGGGDSFPREEPNVYIRMHQGERAHLTKVAETCIRCGIEERRVRIAEEQGRLLARVIKGILDDLGVAQRGEVPGIVRRHLSLVAGTNGDDPSS